MIDLAKIRNTKGFAWVVPCGHMCANHYSWPCCNCEQDVYKCNICSLLKEKIG